MKILYFAWIRQAVGLGSEEVRLPAEIETMAEVMDWLVSRGGGFEEVFRMREGVRMAVDQRYAEPDTAVRGAKELAFFPPMTGG